MRTFLAWLTSRQRCECGNFKPPRASTCFDCSLPGADVIIIELAERRERRHAA
jgi:hypothetical protein